MSDWGWGQSLNVGQPTESWQRAGLPKRTFSRIAPQPLPVSWSGQSFSANGAPNLCQGRPQ